MKYKALGIIACITMLVTLLEPVIFYITLGYEKSTSYSLFIFELISIFISSVLLAMFMSLNGVEAPR